MSDTDITIVSEATKTCGAVSYWRLSGGVELDRLREAWKAEGLDVKLLPKPPRPETALHRAVQDVVEAPEPGQKRRTVRGAGVKSRTLVRPLAKRGAWAIVRETVDGVSYIGAREEATVRWTVTSGGGGAVTIEPSHDSRATAIITAFHAHQGKLAVEDISSWLVALAEHGKSTSLRDTGGVYFVPRDSVEFWRRATTAIKSVSDHRIFKIPAMKNDEAVEAILDAVTEEAKYAAEKMEAELMADESLTARELRTRAKRCEGLLAKVQAYESLLGVKMDVIKSRVVDLSASVAAAALVASSEAA
jgi:hypothetical protein